MPAPNFFIIGSTKAGTSSLARYLPQHPDIAMCQTKEPNYFSYNIPDRPPLGPGNTHWTRWDEAGGYTSYLKLFDHSGQKPIIGEASVSYLFTPGAAEQLHQQLPNARILAVLRNPIERAFSAYMHLKRDGKETLSFMEALAAEEQRKQQGYSGLWLYRTHGFYSRQLKPYLNKFRKSQIWITTYDYWRDEPESFLKDLFQFLEVNHTFPINRQHRENVSGVPQWKWLHRFTSKPSTLKSTLTPFIPQALRRRVLYRTIQWNLQQETIPAACWEDLRDTYQEEIHQLEALLEQDLSHWLQKPASLSSS